MEHPVFSFLQDYLNDLHIQHHVMERTLFSLSGLDLGLRDTILKLNDDSKKQVFSSVDSNCIYHIEDYYMCHYSFLLLPDEASFFFIGPYLTRSLTESDIHELMHTLSIPEELFPQLKDYFFALPLILDKGFFFTFLQRSFCTIFGISEMSSQHVNLRMLESQEEFLKKHEFVVPNDPILSMHLLEERYQLEDAVLDAVAEGNAAKAMMLTERMGGIRLSPRSQNPLRNSKNIYIILNTLLRRTAYLSGVHPLYIDEVSGNYARLIEGCDDERELDELAPLMVQKYCSLVEKKSLSSYSKPVQQILVTIDASLTGDLSLKRFANDLFLNTSYLSALFKKEVGSTLTDYVNQSRIHYACKLLRSTTLSVQDIAAKSGIPDIHYFTRLFRREMGMSPREYRNYL